MRGSNQRQVLMLSTLTPEQLVPADHPIRRIKVIVERALRELSPTFDAMYAALESIASEFVGMWKSSMSTVVQ
jgi:hypothetical protein